MMTDNSRKKLIAWLAAAFLAGAVITGAATFAICKGALGFVSVSKEKYDEMNSAYERFGKLEQLYDTIDGEYYKDIDEQDMLDGAAKGLVAGLGDPYSSYMTDSEYEEWKNSVTGEYSGIGITFTKDDDGNYVIVGVTEDSPADKAGLETGDYILAADGKEYEDQDLMAQAMRGEAGTKVKVTYARDGKENTVTIVRENIVQKSVSYEMLDGSIGYIQLTSFISSSGEDFSAALADLEKQGAKGLILDLRDNGGGLVNQCIEIADEFLDEGVVTYVENKQGERTEYKAEDGKTGLKTVVLVNENSASCSEILAAALQDNGMQLVGAKTFGKGVIQSTMELSDGSALKLTIMQYYSPKGSAIQDKGVTPDYEVKSDKDKDGDEQLNKALSLF